MQTLETARLILRPWREGDAEPFADLNADPEVMEHFPSTLSREEAVALAGRIRAAIEEQGWGLWAIAPKEDPSRFFGFTGLNRPRFEAHFTPCVEIGWRLAKAHWGQGFATEAAREALRFGFEELGLDEIVAFTSPKNHRSIRVMDKLGMARDLDGDFDHPRLAADDPYRRHVLYRVARP